MELKKRFRFALIAISGLWAALLLSACSSTDSTWVDPLDPLHPVTNSAVSPPDKPQTGGVALRVGDELVVSFINVPAPYNTPIDTQVGEDGKVALIHGEVFQALGKTVDQLHDDIIDRYVTNYYKSLDVTITTPKWNFSVGGEVKASGSFPYTGHMNVIDAINLAGGLTDFSSHKHIEVTRAWGRNGKPTKLHDINYDQALSDPTVNIEIYPGDSIHVPRRGLIDW